MRRFSAVVLAVALSLSVSGVALGLTMGLTPDFQAHNHGFAASWALTWGTVAPYTVLFVYDNNNPGWNWQVTGTHTTSKNLSTAFYPCTLTVFTQRLNVIDGTPHGGTLYSSAQEGGGSPC